MTTKLFPPGPNGGLFGRYQLALSRRDPLELMMNAASQYGDIVHFRNGFQHIFLLNHPDYIKDVLLTHDTNFLKGRGIKRTGRILGEGLITSEGDFHRRQKLRTQPAFHRQHTTSYGEVMVDYAATFRERWQDGQTLDILREMRRLTMAIIGKTMLSAVTEEEMDEINKAVEIAMAEFKSFKLPWADLAEKLPLPGTRRSQKAGKYLEGVISRIIDERRRSEKDSGDLLTMLMLAQNQEGDGSPADNEQVRDEALTLFLAGYETNATALMWTWYLVSLHPEVEAMLHAELDMVLKSRLPTADDVPNLRYTEMIFAEAMRLYPPTWRLVRYAIKDYKVGGYVVPAGSLVVVSQFVMHRDPRYFPDPLRFDPERWTPEARASRPPYSYFPFGGGSRRCIAEAFARMEGILVIATLAQRWRMRLLSDHPVELAPVQLLRPKVRMLMVLEQRKGRAQKAAAS